MFEIQKSERKSMSEKQKEQETVAEDSAVEGEVVEAAETEITEENSEEIKEEAPELSETDALKQEIEVLKKQLEDNRDQAVRAQAELDNVRKRTLRDVENAHKYALDKFASDLLPVIDSMLLGIQAAENSESQDGLKEGMDLTLKMFADVLEKFGIKEVDSEGQKFDPEKHEAVSMQSLDGVEAGTVATVLQKGYELNGRLIRPAMVVVAQ